MRSSCRVLFLLSTCSFMACVQSYKYKYRGRKEGRAGNMSITGIQVHGRIRKSPLGFFVVVSISLYYKFFPPLRCRISDVK